VQERLGRELLVALFEHAPRVVDEALIPGQIFRREARNLPLHAAVTRVVEERAVFPDQPVKRRHRQELDVVFTAFPGQLE
jgi:hypothetical protein